MILSAQLLIGLQVVAATLGLAGQYLVNRRSIRGYYLWIGANVVLIPVSAYAGLYVLSALYAVYLGLCVHGVVYWSRKADSVNDALAVLGFTGSDRSQLRMELLNPRTHGSAQAQIKRRLRERAGLQP